MKHSLPLISLSLLLTGLFTGCSSKVLDFRNAETVDGKIYEKGANEPFSGTVTNLPGNMIFHSQAGLRSVVELMQIALNNYRPFLIQYQGSYAHRCEASTANGLLDGDVTCHLPQSSEPFYTMHFKQGRLAGEYILYDGSDSKKILTKVNFLEGQPDGEQDVNGLQTGNKLYSVTWKQGLFNGDQIAVNEQTSKITYKAHWNEGRLEGELLEYTPDGQQIIHKTTFANGLKNGDEDSYSPAGQHTVHGQWINSKPQGRWQRWNEQGQLIEQSQWQDGTQVDTPTTTNPVTTTAPSTANIESCVDSWTTAYHKENGEEAMITADQIKEWESSCKSGQTPH